VFTFRLRTNCKVFFFNPCYISQSLYSITIHTTFTYSMHYRDMNTIVMVLAEARQLMLIRSR
jgi:hypothetical protein